MKLTLHQLVNSKQALEEFAQDRNLPVRTSYFAGKVLRRANTELADYNAARLKLCETHGKMNEAGTQYEFHNGSLEKFKAEVTELLATEIDLPGEPFTLDNLGEATLSPASMMMLDWLIIEG
jgi:hypothetical protein